MGFEPECWFAHSRNRIRARLCSRSLQRVGPGTLESRQMQVGHGPILFMYHWRSAAGRSKVRGTTREDPRATGVAAQPVGFRTHDDDEEGGAFDFAGQAFDARCLRSSLLDPERGRARRGICLPLLPCCWRKFIRTQFGTRHTRAVTRMTWWLGYLVCSHKWQSC